MTDHADGTSHRFFPFESKTAFEPFAVKLLRPDAEMLELLNNMPELYTRQEYVLMTCNCGASIKSKVGEA